MSAIASFFLIETSKLSGLVSNAEIIVKKSLFSRKVTDNYWEYLTHNAQAMESLNGSGYIYGNLFVFLEERQIDLMGNQYDDTVTELVDKRGTTHFIFTLQQADSFLPQLDYKLFSVEEIREFNEEFSEQGDEETARLTIEAIRVLHDNLQKINTEDHVLLLIVG